jgi:hypothetical protein
MKSCPKMKLSTRFPMKSFFRPKPKILNLKKMTFWLVYLQILMRMSFFRLKQKVRNHLMMTFSLVY